MRKRGVSGLRMTQKLCSFYTRLWSITSGMWNKLSSIHEQKSATNKLALTTKFQEYRMTAGDLIPQHVAKVENLDYQLQDIDEAVSNTIVMAKILSTLPAKYNAFDSAWESIATDDQTLGNLRERLLREESRMTTMDSVDSALAAVTIAKQQSNDHRSKGNNAEQRKKTITCNFCMKPSHIARFCFAKSVRKTRIKIQITTVTISQAMKIPQILARL